MFLNGPVYPSKVFLPVGDLGPRLINGTLGEPTRPTTPNGISIKSAVFAKYTFVNNGQNNRPTQNERGTRLVPIAASL